MSGLTERVVEDWLTKSDERTYQLAFAAYLSRLGHTVKYFSPQSATLEHGKDIISISPDHKFYAYQLKAGDINTNLWRDIAEEVREAAVIPMATPGLPTRCVDRAFLVTTGRLSDSVRSKIHLMNIDLGGKGYPNIETHELDELVSGFSRVFESFFPGVLRPVEQLVKLYFTDGRAMQDSRAVLEVQAKLSPDSRSPVRVRRAASNMVVAADFMASPFREAGNHGSVLMTWVSTACQILLISKTLDVRRRRLTDALALCKKAVDDAGLLFLDEVLSRPDFVEGDPLLDTMFLPYRKIVALGLASAVVNSRAAQGSSVREESETLRLVAQRELPLGTWGEGSWNYYVNICVALSHTPRGLLLSEAMVASWLAATCPLKGESPRDPYWTIDQELSLRGAPDPTDLRRRRKISYTAMPALGFLARRMRRQALASVWPAVSKYELARMVPDSPWEELHWTMKQAHLEVRRLPIVGSWNSLCREANQQRSGLFDDESAWLLPYFLCAYPHRVTLELTGELEVRSRPSGY